MNKPVQQPQQIGIDVHGQPIYAWPALQLPAPLTPQRHHQVGAYVAGGCFGLLALVVVAAVVVAVVIGFSIALIVLAIAVVALTICVLVLRSVWADVRGRQ